MTGVGYYNSEYRSFNRGFGRGHPRSFQSSHREPPTQPTRKGDLFIEAGRLAVDYLVSNGLLSSNVLSGKCQNGTFRNNSGEFRDHRGSVDRETIPNSRVDGVSGTRRTANDEDPSLSRNYSRERRRLGVSRSFSSDWGREDGREGTFSDKVTVSQGMDIEDGKFLKGKSKDSDTDVCNSISRVSPPKDDRHSEFQGEMGKSAHVNLDSAMTSVLQNKDGKELSERSNLANTGREETRDDTEKRDQDSEGKNDALSKDDVDLIKLCSSAKIPTKVRSSMTNKSPKSDSLLISEERNDNECDSIASIKDDTMNLGDLSPVYAANKPMPVDSMPLTDKNTFCSEQKVDEQPDLERCSKERGEKRAFEGDNIRGEEAKKAKQWLSVAQSDCSSQLSELREKQCFLPADKTAPANQESFTNMSLPLKGSIESAKEQGEEKQLFGNSFKVFDLNLMQASDMHENRDIPVLMYPSTSAPSKASLIDVDLSMSNNCSLTSSYNGCGAARKDVEIIDLESETLPEGENMNSSARTVEADKTNAGSFQNSSHNPNHNPDGQDGYGFMISELLGNDVPNCSTVQPDMNSLQTEMGLHHGEGMFGEDDSIYMSLGEIPLSLLRGWDQPTQERNPFEM